MKTVSHSVPLAVEKPVDETVYRMLAYFNYPRLGQYIASKDDKFIWDHDLGLYYEGDQTVGIEIVERFTQELVEQVKKTTDKDDIEVFSNESLWELDAFELGQITKIDGYYYNLNELYKYFFTQYDACDPFYNSDDSVSNSIVRGFSKEIQLPATRKTVSLQEVENMMISSDGWWRPYDKKFRIDFTKLQPVSIKYTALESDMSDETGDTITTYPEYGVRYFIDPITGQECTASPVGNYPDDGQYTDYDYWQGRSSEDEESCEIDYPDEDSDNELSSDEMIADRMYVAVDDVRRQLYERDASYADDEGYDSDD